MIFFALLAEIFYQLSLLTKPHIGIFKVSLFDSMENCDYSKDNLLFSYSPDVNECDNNPCENGASCVNSPGGYSCQCAAGWAGAECDQGRFLRQFPRKKKKNKMNSWLIYNINNRY